MLFTYDGNEYGPLLKTPRVFVVYARGGTYAEDSPTPASKFDHQKGYIDFWLKFIGVKEVQTLVVEGTTWPEKEKTAMWGIGRNGGFRTYVRTFPIAADSRGVVHIAVSTVMPGQGATSVLFGITSRHSGISGERPHTALSDVGDPTERHASRTAFRLEGDRRRCSAPRPGWSAMCESASPDSGDCISLTPSLAKTAGRISPSGRIPDPRFFWSSVEFLLAAAPPPRREPRRGAGPSRRRGFFMSSIGGQCHVPSRIVISLRRM